MPGDPAADPAALLAAALEYAGRGWPVFALAPHSKVPRKDTNGVDDATTDPDVIRAWWAATPLANIGMACGREKAPIALDVDRNEAKAKHGDEDLADAETTWGRLPDTLTSNTPTGGSHLFFENPGLPITTRAIGHVDVQRDGFYVVMAPSVTVDGAYVWDVGQGDNIVALPERWVTGLTHVEPPRVQTSRATGFTHGASPIDDYNARTDLAAVLVADGASVGATWIARPRANGPGGPCRTVTRPGKDVHEGSSAQFWVGEGERCDVLNVFSTTWPSLPAGSYSPFQYYEFTRHGGDLTVARRQLRSEGYGDPLGLSGSGPQSAQAAFGEDSPAWLLPDEFWTSRRDLEHIRQAALSRSISPDAVLGAVLARAVSMTHRAITIPPGVRRVGLEFFAALVAGPGIGKGAAMDCARDLIPSPADHPGGWIEAPIGSGEGLVKLFFGLVDEINPATGKSRTVQRQVRHNVMIRIDEVETLVRLAKRQDQTTMTTLRTAWSGEALGGSYSDDGKDRRVPRLAYRLGVVIGVQPAVAGPIFDDADGGTPQRFSWFGVAYPPMPDLPPAWPGSLYWAPPVPDWGDHELFRDVTVAPVAVAQMRADHLAAVRGAVVDPLSAHSNLRRLKTAVALAVLAGRLDVNPEDWALAGTMATTSDAVRDSIRSGLAAEGRARVEQQVNLAGRKRTAERLAESTFDDDARSKRVEQAVAIIVTRLARETEPIAWRVLRDALNSRLRSVATDARVVAAERGLIVEVPDGWQVAPL